MPYRVENITRKGEIACDKQFLLFSQCFHSYISLVCQNAILCGNGLNLYHAITTLNDPVQATFGKHREKRRKCWHPAFSTFLQDFLLFPRQILIFKSRLFCRLQILSIWTSLTFCRLVNSSPSATQSCKATFNQSINHPIYQPIKQAFN